MCVCGRSDGNWNDEKIHYVIIFIEVSYTEINVKYMLVGHTSALVERLNIYKIPLQQTCTELQGRRRGGLQRLCSSIIGYLVMDDVQPGAGCSDFAAVSLAILYLRGC